MTFFPDASKERHDMELFSTIIPQVRSFMEGHGASRTWQDNPARPWPGARGRNIVLKEDTGLELGSPDKESLSCLLWTEDLSLITDSRITLLGPDFAESASESLAFGKVVLLGVQGFDEDNAYDRHKDLDFLRYDLDLKGFMMRAVSQYMREWCRISHEALREGFSAQVLGTELMRLFRRMPYVASIEVLFVTTSKEDVLRLKEITASAERIIAAMNKMAAEFDYDCASCDYQEVCDEADGLRSMRERLMKDGSAREAAHG